MVKSKNTSNQQDNTDSGVSLRQKEIDSILTGGSSQHKAPNLSQKEIDARVGQVLDVLPSMSKQAIKRALEENDYNVGDVVTQILDGVSQWTEVKKKEAPKKPQKKVASEPKNVNAPASREGKNGRGRGARSSTGDRARGGRKKAASQERKGEAAIAVAATAVAATATREGDGTFWGSETLNANESIFETNDNQTFSNAVKASSTDNGTFFASENIDTAATSSFFETDNEQKKKPTTQAKSRAVSVPSSASKIEPTLSYIEAAKASAETEQQPTVQQEQREKTKKPKKSKQPKTAATISKPAVAEQAAATPMESMPRRTSVPTTASATVATTTMEEKRKASAPAHGEVILPQTSKMNWSADIGLKFGSLDINETQEEEEEEQKPSAPTIPQAQPASTRPAQQHIPQQYMHQQQQMYTHPVEHTSGYGTAAWGEHFEAQQQHSQLQDKNAQDQNAQKQGFQAGHYPHYPYPNAYYPYPMVYGQQYAFPQQYAQATKGFMYGAGQRLAGAQHQDDKSAPQQPQHQGAQFGQPPAPYGFGGYGYGMYNAQHLHEQSTMGEDLRTSPHQAVDEHQQSLPVHYPYNPMAYAYYGMYPGYGTQQHGQQQQQQQPHNAYQQSQQSSRSKEQAWNS